MATLQLKASRKEQRSVIHFLWAKRRCQIPFSLRCVQYMVTSVLQDQQYMFGVKKFACGRESVVDEKKDLANLLFQRLIQRSQQSRLSYGLTGVYQ